MTKTRLFDYWQQNDGALEAEFERAKGIVMVDKEPLVEMNGESIKIVEFQNKGTVNFTI